MPSAATTPRFEYVREPAISEPLDAQLRELFSACFRKEFFRERRYAYQMPLHRYLLTGDGGQVLAHVAVHEKRIGVGSEELSVGGISEVCVHESLRGQGRAKELLDHAHRGLRERGFEFAMLFGDGPIYGSSGYLPLVAEIRRFDPTTQTFKSEPSAVARHKPLTDRAWPEGPIDIRGPMF